MKNYNKILEAVNRGIKFALDDFDDIDDNEELQGLSNSKVKYLGGIKEYVNLIKDIIDLGLPSRTKWFKYNLDVDYKKLDSNPNNSIPEDWYGGYYAWGELEPNKTNENGEIYFSWKNYKFGRYGNLIKYCYKSRYRLNANNLTQLLPEDDAAYLNKKLYNYKFRTPTEKLCEELIKHTRNYWVNNYDPNKTIHNPENDEGIKGLNGRIFEGKNGNLLFIPAAGYYVNSYINICNVGSDSYLWSSNHALDDPDYAHALRFDSNDIFIFSYDRCCGMAVRPVIKL